MILNKPTVIRPAQLSDSPSIDKLVKYGAKVHRHLDWRQPTEWIGKMPFFVAEWNDQLLAALSCSTDSSPYAWLRLFAVDSLVDGKDAWKGLWEDTKEYLKKINTSIAVITSQRWLINLIQASSFQQTDSVILLERNHQSLPPEPGNMDVSIRNMTSEDLRCIYAIDKTAFTPLWQHSLELIEVAFAKSSLSTVAEVGKEIIGYQISTANMSSGHLARLAVLPEWQGKGIGYALIYQMISIFSLWGTLRMTVNTQVDNYSSLALYRKVGFIKTDKVFPVYQRDLSV